MTELERPILPLIELVWPEGPPLDDVLLREWLVTNGMGGYASGTLGGCNTRKYHGLFIPNLLGHGRVVMIARMDEVAVVGGRSFRLDCEHRADGTLDGSGASALRAFRLEGLLPEWDYALGEARLRRRMVLVHRENTIFVAYHHLGGPELRLKIRPYPIFRDHDGPLLQPGHRPPAARLEGGKIELMAGEGAPALKVRVYSPTPTPFVGLPETSAPQLYRVEKARGYEHIEVQQSPGYFDCTLSEGQTVAFATTLEGWEALDRSPEEAFELERERELRLLVRAPPKARVGPGARLVLAADQFIIEPVNRPADVAWARATGEDARSLIAGYPWFTDWGRDTMISLEGLTMLTGRAFDASAILRTFQHYLWEGLLPNLFPEGGREGLYHTADATLWLFHALSRYLEVTGDTDLLVTTFPSLVTILHRHVRGTRFNIGVDPDDGLLRQGAPGYQLTWMDAKVDGWVVTPRRGKAVEINALWYNALRLMVDWAEQLDQNPTRYRELAERVFASFNRRFWNAEACCLYDVVDGEGATEDAAIRPNQIFAISLAHPVLRRERWGKVLETVDRLLLTPVGLRSLSPDHPDFKRTYDGDLRARDAAYHQGTVWPWLIGHYVDARLKVDPEASRLKGVLSGLRHHLENACVGQVSEIFDACDPFRPRGCFAQAWSVAEVLRVWLKISDVLDGGRT